MKLLYVHAKFLNIPLYQKGYFKDSPSVAAEEIKRATTDCHDVVLVNTGGIMQNNISLIKALSRLFSENDLDLVLFVSEALEGKDGKDQVKMCDRALRSGSSWREEESRRQHRKRRIDGNILTKYYAVSDKVDAALTITPGKKCKYLRKLSEPAVIRIIFD